MRRRIGERRRVGPLRKQGWPAYRLRYIQADSAIKTTVMIQSEESLIPVFLAMRRY